VTHLVVPFQIKSIFTTEDTEDTENGAQ